LLGLIAAFSEECGDVEGFGLCATSVKTCADHTREFVRGDDYDDRMTTTTMTGLMAR
jgi:hypothetical protein